MKEKSLFKEIQIFFFSLQNLQLGEFVKELFTFVNEAANLNLFNITPDEDEIPGGYIMCNKGIDRCQFFYPQSCLDMGLKTGYGQPLMM